MSTEELKRVVRRSAKEGKETRIVCPLCGPERRVHKGEPTLSIRLMDDGVAVYHCWHCEERGGVKMLGDDDFKMPAPEPYRGRQDGRSLSAPAYNYLSKERGLSIATVNRYGLFSEVRRFRLKGDFVERPAIGFPYYDDKGEIYAAKFRSPDKLFTQEGSANTFYGLEHVPESATEIVITEGEMDCLSVAEADFPAVVSVPNGAPDKPTSSDHKFAYLAHAQSMIKRMKRVLIALDNDRPGELLGEELARRIGRARCWKVSYPEGCKDANDVLKKHGREILADCIAEAEPWPIKGVYEPSVYAADVLDLYAGNMPRGSSTGFESVDSYFTLQAGHLIILTGVPSNGKSEFVDQIMVNTAVGEEKWRWAVWSYENPPSTHIIKLVEKYIRRPFYGERRMIEKEVNEGIEWVNEHFTFIEAGDEQAATIDFLLECAESAVLRYGIKGFVIDPYNYIEHNRANESETDFVSGMLTKVRAFCRNHGVTCFFVAHPRKLEEDKDGEIQPPGGYSISGSAAWYSKADVGVTIHKRAGMMTQVIVWKCRFKWIGREGSTLLSYDIENGTYHEAEEVFRV